MAREGFEYWDIPGVSVVISRSVPEFDAERVDWGVQYTYGLSGDFTFAGYARHSDLELACYLAYENLTANNRRELERILWLAYLKLERMQNERVDHRSDQASNQQQRSPELDSLALEGASAGPSSNHHGLRRWNPFK